jgi:hypothetical protein
VRAQLATRAHPGCVRACVARTVIRLGCYTKDQAPSLAPAACRYHADLATTGAYRESVARLYMPCGVRPIIRRLRVHARSIDSPCASVGYISGCSRVYCTATTPDLLTSSIGEGSSENRVGVLLFSGKIGDTFRDWASEVCEQ